MKAKVPERARESLALRFRQNWLARHPMDSSIAGPLDDSLTSLGWLQNLNILKTLATPPASPEPLFGGSGCAGPLHTRVNPNHVLNIKQEPSGTTLPPPRSSFSDPRPTTHLRLSHGRLEITPMQQYGGVGGRMDVAPPLLSSLSAADRIDYRTNHSGKPPFSYATLICMAMRESHKSKMTLAGIYSWITENFAYYRHAEPSWQNSIRHNLSLNKCFQKVARRKDEPGKGGFWRINPEYSHMFVNGVFKKRRPGSGGYVTPPGMSPPAKRIKPEPADSDTEEGYLAAMAISNEMGAGYANPWDSGVHSHSSAQGTYNGMFSDHSDLVKSDFNWNAIFHQDIDVSGVRVKTEEIIDGGIGDQVGMESPITALSPPASPTGSSDPGLDDLLGSLPGGGDLDCPLDLSTGGELDLTITGTSLKAPDWWSGSVRGMGVGSAAGSRSGLSTPVAPSPVPEPDDPHPWAEPRSLDQAMFDLDLQNLFEDDSFSGFDS